MNSTLIYKRFFAYSETRDKSFNTNFSKGLNIIHGKNTSGKSTLIQAIHYTFGINDEKHKLSEVLNERLFFRLDFSLMRQSMENITIIREGDFIFIKREGQAVRKFTGISGNNSEEHRILKKYLADLFGFNLHLETSDEYKLASLEAMFLPYYVAQDYGWVLALKSFRGLDFFRNFKYDYYDYYLGITNEYDRIEKQRLELKKKQYENEIKFLIEVETDKEDLNLSKLNDETFIYKTIEYIESYRLNKSKLIEYEKDYLINCNKLSFLEERLSVLKKVKRSLDKHTPIESDCPTCNQKISDSIENVYEYFQDINDTVKQIEVIDKNSIQQKELKGKINSLESKLILQRDTVAKDYSLLLQYKTNDLTFNSWLDNKANIQLIKNISTQIGDIRIQLDKVIKDLSLYKTEDDIKNERNKKDYSFSRAFEDNLNKLGVKPFDDKKYLLLYFMNLFPKQGVELLKTLLAYYFAFNQIIKGTGYVHRFPFMMDAIFKEDIDSNNKELILKFISANKPNDTQMIISIAESIDDKKSVADYNKEWLGNTANLIKISTEKERSFLSEFKEQYRDYLIETLALME